MTLSMQLHCTCIYNINMFVATWRDSAAMYTKPSKVMQNRGGEGGGGGDCRLSAPMLTELSLLLALEF